MHVRHSGCSGAEDAVVVALSALSASVVYFRARESKQLSIANSKRVSLKSHQLILIKTDEQPVLQLDIHTIPQTILRTTNSTHRLQH